MELDYLLENEKKKMFERTFGPSVARRKTSDEFAQDLILSPTKVPLYWGGVEIG